MTDEKLEEFDYRYVCPMVCERRRNELWQMFEKRIQEVDTRHQKNIDDISHQIQTLNKKIDINHTSMSDKVDKVKWYIFGLAITILISIIMNTAEAVI